MMTQKKWFQLLQHQFKIAFSSTVNGEHNLCVQNCNKNEESVCEPDDDEVPEYVSLPELP